MSKSTRAFEDLDSADAMGVPCSWPSPPKLFESSVRSPVQSYLRNHNVRGSIKVASFYIFAILTLASAARAQTNDETEARLRERIAELETENARLRAALEQIEEEQGTAPASTQSDLDDAVMLVLETHFAGRWYHASRELDLAKEGRIDGRQDENVKLVDGEAVFRNTTAKRDAIKRASENIAAVKSSPFERPMGNEQLREGWIGRIMPLNVLQVIDENALLGSTTIANDDGWIIDRPDMWVEMPTAGIVDGDRIGGRVLSDMTFMVIGRKQYQTAAGGSKTVWHVRVIDLNRYVNKMKASGFDPCRRSTWPVAVSDRVLFLTP